VEPRLDRLELPSWIFPTRPALAPRDEPFSAGEQLPLAEFLAGYSVLTRDAGTLDLRQSVTRCTEHRMAVFRARRADIQCFARHVESLGPARGHHRPSGVHRGLFQPLRRTRGADRRLSGGACASTPA
jgi:hypothetical protein